VIECDLFMIFFDLVKLNSFHPAQKTTGFRRRQFRGLIVFDHSGREQIPCPALPASIRQTPSPQCKGISRPPTKERARFPLERARQLRTEMRPSENNN
jgi:hypothetical protein